MLILPWTKHDRMDSACEWVVDVHDTGPCARVRVYSGTRPKSITKIKIKALFTPSERELESKTASKRYKYIVLYHSHQTEANFTAKHILRFYLLWMGPKTKIYSQWNKRAVLALIQKTNIPVRPSFSVQPQLKWSPVVFYLDCNRPDISGTNSPVVQVEWWF